MGGPVAVRVDAIEGTLAALPNRRRLEQAFDQLGVEGTLRAIVVKHAGNALGGQGRAAAVSP